MSIKFNDKALKLLLVEKGLTQSEFAKKLGMSSSGFSKYMNGTVTPPLEVLEKISIALEYPLFGLLVFDKQTEALFAEKSSKTRSMVEKKAILEDLLPIDIALINSFCGFFLHSLLQSDFDKATKDKIASMLQKSTNDYFSFLKESWSLESLEKKDK